MPARPGAFFSRFADVYDTFYDGKRTRVMQWIDRRFRSDMFVRFSMTFQFLGDLVGRRILDIGCGSGPYLAEALRRGAAHATGVDPAPRMLELARERIAQIGATDRVTLIEGYFPEVCPPGPFDYAIVMGVLDYVEEPAPFLRRLWEVVSGGAAISFPSRHWFRTPVRRLRYRLRRCPVSFYDEDQIRGLMRRAGVPRFRTQKIPGAGMDYVVTVEKDA